MTPRQRRSEPDDAGARFGQTCPVCGQRLGHAPPPTDPETRRFALPPSFRLEAGMPDGAGATPWRVTALAGNYPPAESIDPTFNEHEVDFAYLLCGGGHVFPDATPLYRPGGFQRTHDARQRVEEWNMVAAIGAPASGKTYLLVRMLSQNLDTLSDWSSQDSPGRVRQRKLSPLEELPLSGRIRKYNQTRIAGDAIDPTGTDRQATPAGILEDQFGDALEAIKELIRRTVADGDRKARNWGRAFRQPLVLRTDSDGRRTWTGVADLPGELFDDNRLSQREAGMLRAFDGLLWVLDPLVSPSAMDWLVTNDASERQMLDGSLRPGTVVGDDGANVVRGNRESIQDDIGRQITLVDGPFAVNEGHRLQVLVAITKCDLIHNSLKKLSMNLAELGSDDQVVERGVATYLKFTMDAWARGELEADTQSADILAYVQGAQNAANETRERRAMQVARGLLAHYSEHSEFWKLVHGGGESRVTIARGDGMSERRIDIRVPSLDEHLTAALRPGSFQRILARDLVMSAVGCGVAYGLGQETALYRIQREEWMTLRFFLCSPLGTVPIAVDDVRLKPLDPQVRRFPKVDDRSAALTQLLLAVLGKARR